MTALTTPNEVLAPSISADASWFNGEHGHVSHTSASCAIGCPLCGLSVWTGGEITCTGPPKRRHAPIRITWLWDDQEKYEAMYTDPAAYHIDMQEAEGQEGFWNRDTQALIASHARLDVLEGMIGPVRGKRLCDVGAGTGAFVAAALMRGAEAWGIEPCTVMAVKAHGMGRNLGSAGWRDSSYREDILTAHDVMEHVVNPAQFLCAISNRMNPGAVAVIEMPELDAPNEAWRRHIRPRQHIMLYSAAAAEELYARCKFTVIGFTRPLRGQLGKMAHFLTRAEG